jgi:hypothetical protein
MCIPTLRAHPRPSQTHRAESHQIVLACSLSLALLSSGCGGGGNGGGRPAIPSGTFSLSTNSAAFTMTQGGALPASQSVVVSVTGAGVASVSVGSSNGQPLPAWLNTSVTGSGSTFRLSVAVAPNGLTTGQYASVLAITTVDSSGHVLVTQDLAVSLTVDLAMAITTPPVSQSLIFGDTVVTVTAPIAVLAGNRQWTASSSAPWLRVPTGRQSDNATFAATLDATGLAPGTYTGLIQVVNTADASDSASLSVTLVITPAAMTVTPGSVVFGGDDGRSAPTTVALAVALSTGKGVYPFTVTLSTTSGGQWLTVDHSSGTVGSAGSTVTLRVGTAPGHGGTYTGTATISARVSGAVVAATVPVTLNIEANRLVVSAAGVGMSQLPGRSVLTRTVQVFSSLGRTDIPWTANSDSAWLTVTGSGTTGGALTLTANPAGTPLDSTQFANVIVSSVDATIENNQTIRVGLFVSNAAPAPTSVAIAAEYLAASPVEPIVAVNTGGTSVGLYDVYSGTLLRTLPGVAATAGPMVFGEDGRSLFISDTTNFRVTEVDSAGGAILATFDSSGLAGSSLSGIGIITMHASGFSMLVTPVGRFYDLATGSQFTSSSISWPSTAQSFAVSPDQSLLATQDGYTNRVMRSALNGGTIVAQPRVVVPPILTVQNATNGQSCFSITGDRIYTASGAPYNFPATSVATSQVIQTLPGNPYPDAIQCAWNGLVIGGIDVLSNAPDIFIYYGPTGVSLGQTSSTAPGSLYSSLLSRGLAVSADGTMLVSASPNQFPQAGSTAVYFQMLPAPP